MRPAETFLFYRAQHPQLLRQPPQGRTLRSSLKVPHSLCDYSAFTFGPCCRAVLPCKQSATAERRCSLFRTVHPLSVRLVSVHVLGHAAMQAQSAGTHNMCSVWAVRCTSPDYKLSHTRHKRVQVMLICRCTGTYGSLFCIPVSHKTSKGGKKGCAR